MLFSKSARRYALLDRTVRLVRIERRPGTSPSNIRPHAASGLCDFIAAIKEQKQGLLSYDVPVEQTDGLCSVRIVVEIQ
jgi:hypothetical protein